MAYADYTFYTTTYLGTKLNEEQFARLSTKASMYIDSATMGRASKYTDTDDKLAFATCELAEAMNGLSIDGESAVVASETVGAHSVSYRDAATLSSSMRQAWNSILNTYLMGTGLLFRGIAVVHSTHCHDI